MVFTTNPKPGIWPETARVPSRSEVGVRKTLEFTWMLVFEIGTSVSPAGIVPEPKVELPTLKLSTAKLPSLLIVTRPLKKSTRVAKGEFWMYKVLKLLKELPVRERVPSTLKSPATTVLPKKELPKALKVSEMVAW